MTNINEVLEGHVGLDLACVDRLYLNAYVPTLQVPGQVVTFMTGHLGLPIPSPVVMQRIGTRFRGAVKAFADEHDIPLLHLKKPDRTRWDDRKLDHVTPYLEQAEREGRFGVVAIVAAQEYQWVFSAKNRSSVPGRPSFDFVKEERRVGTYYFYVLDPEFGPGFVKICTYFPYPAKVWVNGHEWAKRQATREGLVFAELKNGFATCTDHARLQAICDRFGPAEVEGFFERTIALIPIPFSEVYRAAGYFYELSMGQVEVSRTLVFDDPRRARSFFEALVEENVSIGHPDEMAAVFSAQVRRRGPRKTPGPFRTRVFTPGTEVKVDFSFRTAGSSNTSKKGGPCESKPSSTNHLTWASCPGSPTFPSSSSAGGRSMTDSLGSNVPVRAVPSALRSSSASTSPSKMRANEPELCASGINAPWPWPVPCASSSVPSPASPTRAFAGGWPDSSAGITARAR